jgi:hypothetical protein
MAELTIDDVIRRLTIEQTEKYYNWARHIVTLSGSALTLLVSLQKNYVPQKPDQIWILQLCWTLLAVSILSGSIVLYGEQQNVFDARKKLVHRRREVGDAALTIELSNGWNYTPRKIFHFFYNLMAAGFSLSLVCLAWFSSLNLALQ